MIGDVPTIVYSIVTNHSNPGNGVCAIDCQIELLSYLSFKSFKKHGYVKFFFSCLIGSILWATFRSLL
jgi:hypothetical protein